MGVVTGLLLGAGLFLIWLSAWEVLPVPRTSSRWAARGRDLLIQAGMESVTLGALAGLSFTSAAVVGVLGLALTGSAPIAGSFAVMAASAPTALVSSRARRRRVRFSELWPEVIDTLASGIRAGLSLPEALSHIGDRGPVELRPQFVLFAREYRGSGQFEECLLNLKERMADPVADRIVESLRLARDVGGSDLSKLLRTLSTFLREDNRTRGELEARQSWTVAGARLAVAGP